MAQARSQALGEGPGAVVWLCVVAIVLAAGGSGAGIQGEPSYEVAPARSRAVVEVGKAGVLSFLAGHTHVVEAPLQGTLSVDPEHPERAVVAIEIRTADLTVSGKDEPPEDVPKVQQTMAGAEVLDVARYPAITFRSTAIAVQERSEAALDLRVTGDLTLHGETRPLEVPVHAELTSNGIVARGTLSVRQTDYGIRPVSVGGVVAVKDELTVHFTIVAPAARAPA